MPRAVNKLSDVTLRRLMKDGAPVAKADGDGLTFTLSAGGTASWVLRYRFSGKPRELTLGQYPGLSIAKARERTREERVLIQKGADVAAVRQKQKAEQAVAGSFRELAFDYIDKVFPRLAASTQKQRRQHIEGVIIPKLGAKPARDIGPAEVVAFLNAIQQTKTPSVIELVFTALSEIFKHGQGKHGVLSNPCAGLSLKAICGTAPVPRKRIMLSAVELHHVLTALPSIGVQNGHTVKLLMLTGVRIGELFGARWENVNLTAGTWWVPDEDAKEGRGYTVPLTASAVSSLRALKVLACGSAFVLPARQSGRKAKAGGDTNAEQRLLNAMLHKLCDGLGDKVRRFTPHDLRSTLRSHLTALGVDRLTAERCLNHSLGGLVAIYDLHDYLPERRAALEKLEGFLLQCEANLTEPASPPEATALAA